MKTKFHWVALLASAALIAQAKAGGHHGGGGGGGAIVMHSAPAHVAAPSSFQSGPRGNFGRGRFMASGPRFSSNGIRPANSFRQQRVLDSNRANRGFDAARALDHRENRLVRNGNNNRFDNRQASAARNHVFARRTADWHRDWDRHHDHWWNGHRCRFVNGSWFIYDINPYDYWYPYDYYAYGSYPYAYDEDVYDGGDPGDYGQGVYDSSTQDGGSPVAAVQQQLARQGYYRGEIDGVFGPETRRAIIAYQSGHGLRATGNLNTDTLRALGLPRVASN
jgi:Putative peptidoglycan binding domain